MPLGHISTSRREALLAMIEPCESSRRPRPQLREIASLYRQLSALLGSPVIELNRAVAVGMAKGPAAGLAII